MTATTTDIPSASLTGTTPSTRSIRRRLATTPVWRVGVVAGLAAAAATELFALVARAAGVSMKAASGGGAPERFPTGAFAEVTFGCALVGTVLAVVLARRAQRPARTFLVVTVALTAISLLAPFVALDAGAPTAVILVLAHVLAAAVVIPPLARRLSH